MLPRLCNIGGSPAHQQPRRGHTGKGEETVLARLHKIEFGRSVKAFTSSIVRIRPSLKTRPVEVEMGKGKRDNAKTRSRWQPAVQS